MKSRPYFQPSCPHCVYKGALDKIEVYQCTPPGETAVRVILRIETPYQVEPYQEMFVRDFRPDDHKRGALRYHGYNVDTLMVGLRLLVGGPGP